MKICFASALAPVLVVAGGGHHFGAPNWISGNELEAYSSYRTFPRVGGYGAGTSSYAALALQSSGSGVVTEGYGLYAAPSLPSLPALSVPVHVLPPVGQFHAPLRAALQEAAPAEQYVSHEGPMLQNEVNSYSRKTTVAITHRPVYHKTILNHYTVHDRVNKDVLHHIGEKEFRNFDVPGEELHGGSMEIQHGDKGHAAYESLVAQHTGGLGVHGVQLVTGPGTVGGYIPTNPVAVQPSLQTFERTLNGVAIEPNYQTFERTLNGVAIEPNYQTSARHALLG